MNLEIQEKKSRVPTICLNMIVRNESKIITRLLETVLPIIDTYCICDTGSTDETKTIIKEYLDSKNIPGKIIEHPFKNFGHNRDYALKAAKDMADYLLFLDADMKLVIDPSFDKNLLTADVYSIRQGVPGFTYHNVRLLSTSIDAACVGSTHEHYSYPSESSQSRLESLHILDIGDGGCKEDKFERDIRLLKGDIEENPNNPRPHFYIANSYYSIGKFDEALEEYKKRISLGGWYEEVWYSHYRTGSCYYKKGQHEMAIFWWLEGFNMYPKRMENIYEIVKHYRINGRPELASHFYKLAKSIPKPEKDSLFIHDSIYDRDLDYEFTVFYYYLEDKSSYPPLMIHELCCDMLEMGCNVQNVLGNYKFYTQVLTRDKGGQIVELRAVSIKENYISSTPSIVDYQGGYLVNIRHNNTTIDDNWGYAMSERDEITRNQFVIMDEKYTKKDWGVMRLEDEPKKENPLGLFFGRQDVRLLNHDGDIYYTATISPEVDEKKAWRVEYGRYYPEGKRLVGKCIKPPSYGNVECEKNWTLFSHEGKVKCVYGWSPLRIGYIDEEKKEFVEEWQVKVGGLFSMIRGSSNGAWYKDHLWFVCHIVSYETPRQYYHLLVVLDKDLKSVKYVTFPFKFEGAPIEYCCGLLIKNDELMMTYSVKDGCSKIMKVLVSAFGNFMDT